MSDDRGGERHVGCGRRFMPPELWARNGDVVLQLRVRGEQTGRSPGRSRATGLGVSPGPLGRTPRHARRTPGAARRWAAARSRRRAGAPAGGRGAGRSDQGSMAESGPTGPPGRRLGAGRGPSPSSPVKRIDLLVDSRKGEVLHSYAESSAVEPGEGQMGDFGLHRRGSPVECGRKTRSTRPSRG